MFKTELYEPNTPLGSPNSMQVSSHFERITSPNRKGMARHRCLMCGHEFTCSGKRRHIQHILGKDYSASQRNIKECPNPFLPLKVYLLKQYGGSSGRLYQQGPIFDLTSEDIIPENLMYSFDTMDDERDNDGIMDIFDDLLAGEEEKKIDTTCSSETENEIMTFNHPSLSSLSFEMPPSAASAASTASSSHVMHHSPSFIRSERVHQAIQNFFSAYNIPMDAVQDPTFQTFYHTLARSCSQENHNHYYPAVQNELPFTNNFTNPFFRR